MIRTAPGAIALAMIGLAAATTGAAAQGKKLPSASIGIFDSQELLRSSKVGQDITRQLQPQGQALSDEVNRNREALRREQEELRRQQTLLAADAFAQKERQFGEKWNGVNQQIEARRQALARSEQAALLEVRKQLRPIVESLAREMGFNLVLEKQATLYNAESLDITRQVVQRLDQSLPALQVPAAPAQQ